MLSGSDWSRPLTSRGTCPTPTRRYSPSATRTRPRARRVSQQFGIAKYYTSYTEMLTDPAINTIDIMTPTYLHRPMAVAAARAGKNIHCEKPLGLHAGRGRGHLR